MISDQKNDHVPPASTSKSEETKTNPAQAKKEKLGFFDKLLGFKSVEEKKLSVKLKQLLSENNAKEAQIKAEEYLKTQPHSQKIKKLSEKAKQLSLKISKKEKSAEPSKKDQIKAQLEKNISEKLKNLDQPQPSVQKEEEMPFSPNMPEKSEKNVVKDNTSEKEAKATKSDGKEITKETKKPGFLKKLFHTSEAKAESKKESGPQNMFTKLFKEKKAEPTSIIETIVQQQDAKKSIQKQKTKDSAIFDKALSTKPKEEKHKNTKKVFLNFLIFLIIATVLSTFAFFASALDSENRLLSLFRIKNIGSELKKSSEEKVKIQKSIVNIKKEISALEKNAEIENIKKTILNIQKRRVAWTEVLKEVQLTIAKVPQSFRNDFVFNNYSGDLKDNTIQVSGTAKNEKVFTLVADLLDKIEENENFYNADFRRFSKSPDKEEASLFQSNVQLKFNFLPQPQNPLLQDNKDEN